MKTTLIIISMLFFSFFLQAQDLEGYSKHWFKTKDCFGIGYSTSYYEGKTWLFMSGLGDIYFAPLSVSTVDGHIHNMASINKIDRNLDETITPINSVVFNQNLYAFEYNPTSKNLYYFHITESEKHHTYKVPDFDLKPDSRLKMSAVSLRDTLYLFFVGKELQYINCLKGVADGDEIHWFNTIQTLEDSNNNNISSSGNVAACTYHTAKNIEEIMLVYPGPKTSKDQNDLIYYFGSGDHFKFHHKKASSTASSGDHSAYNVAIMEGVVNGGMTKTHVMQTVYTTVGGAKGDMNNKTKMFRYEFDLIRGKSSSWETLPESKLGSMAAPELMEYYMPDGNAKEIRKYMYLLYNDDLSGEIDVLLWESNLLKEIGTRTDVATVKFKNDLWNLTAVVDGPPPIALNRNSLFDLGNDHPSSFIYGKQQTQTVTSSTTYTKTIEASGGFGPISAGFKKTLHHLKGTTDETSTQVTTIITPPLSAKDSCGIMECFYIAPTLMRTQWKLLDYNGDTMLNGNRSLFLFNFINPQLKIVSDTIKYKNSPQLNNLYSYKDRGVLDFNGLKTLRPSTELDQDIANGIHQDGSFKFDKITTKMKDESKSVTLGINVGYSIFDVSIGHTIDLEFSREHTMEMEHSFDIIYNNPKPKFPKDKNNVLSYTTIAYLMKTTDSTAYFLPEGLKNARPIFVTWEVKSIVKGPYSESAKEGSIIKNKK